METESTLFNNHVGQMKSHLHFGGLCLFFFLEVCSFTLSSHCHKVILKIRPTSAYIAIQINLKNIN